MATATLISIAKASPVEVAPLFIAAAGYAAELDVIPASTIVGHIKEFPRFTLDDDEDDGWADEGKGTAATDTPFDTVQIQTARILKNMCVDKYKMSAAGANKAEYLSTEALAKVQRARLSIGKAIIYGKTTGSNTFTGVKANAYATVKAGGTTADTTVEGVTTGHHTSAYLVYVGVNGARVVLGDNGAIDNPPWDENGFGLDSDGNRYPAYTSHVQMFPSFFSGDPKGIVRLANIDFTTAGGLTDAKIATAIQKFPPYLKVNKADIIILMNAAAVASLQNSRTATNPTGQPAPFPTDCQGYRIVETTSITNAELLVA